MTAEPRGEGAEEGRRRRCCCVLRVKEAKNLVGVEVEEEVGVVVRGFGEARAIIIVGVALSVEAIFYRLFFIDAVFLYVEYR